MPLGGAWHQKPGRPGRTGVGAVVWGRKFLGYCWTSKGEVRRVVACVATGTTIFRELRGLGASNDLAARIAGGGRRWWYTSGLGLNRVLTIAYFDRLGVPRLS